jgi:hypothetical protein
MTLTVAETLILRGYMARTRSMSVELAQRTTARACGVSVQRVREVIYAVPIAQRRRYVT